VVSGLTDGEASGEDYSCKMMDQAHDTTMSVQPSGQRGGGSDRRDRHSVRLNIVIRAVERADYEQLTRFFAENNVTQVTRHFKPFPLDSGTAYHIACARHLDRYYVALAGERVVGLSMLRGWDDGYQTPSFGLIVDVIVHACGVGKRMTEYAIAEAKRIGCHRVRLSVYASNPIAIKLYSSLGFVEHAREAVVVMGEPDEKITMFKELP
jgi:ribosomal protein S18 acetylase RimI-like enzyme